MTDPMIFTQLELSWILAGRDTPSAQQIRQLFGVSELKEGEPRVLEAVQSLLARNLVEVVGEEIKPSSVLALFAYTLCNADYWTQLSLQLEGQSPEVLFTVANSDLKSAFILRAGAMGVMEVTVTNPEVHPAMGFGKIIETYIESGEDMQIGLSRRFAQTPKQLFLVKRQGNSWQLLRRQGIDNSADLIDVEARQIEVAEILEDTQKVLN